MTPKGQRIGILVIAVVMIVGTLGSFAILIMGNDNALKEREQQAKEYQAEMEKQQKAYEEQQKLAAQLSEKYYPIFKEYKDAPEQFDAESVGDKVTHKDLREGTGETINKDSTYKAYYIGWNPKGVEFDSSFDSDKLKAPLDVSAGMLIPGWYEGVEGMKIGGVREITIPSDLAYGEEGSGDKIPPNTPIKFIVFVAEKN